MTYLSVTISPEIYPHPDGIIDRRIRRLIHQRSRQSHRGKSDQSRRNTTMESRPSNDTQRPLPSEHDNAKDQIDNLQRGERLHGEVEIFGEEVPENLGPEKSFDCGCYLV
jgi:hypothetical protein